MRSHWRHLSILSVLVAALFMTGCPTEDPEPDPSVVTSGDHGLEVATTLTVTAATVDGTDGSYTWASSDESVATVDASGVVTGVAAGEANITATGVDTGAVGDHAIVVYEPGTMPPMPDVTIEITGDFSLLVMDTSQLTATTYNDTDATYTWASSDVLVATVDAAGLVTALAEGETIITATGDDSGAVGSYGILVMDPFDVDTVPYYNDWVTGPHADSTAEAFIHWDGDMPPEVPTSCARCHTSTGFRDLIGDDGSAVGTVENPVPVGEVIDCNACHNPTAIALTTVTFPSGVIIDNLGSEARCMTCHQGRNSTDSVDADILAAAPVDDDTVTMGLGFLNIHYFSAGATLWGGLVRGGYQYAGMSYDARNFHMESKDTCIECHDQHTLELRFDECDDCHPGVANNMDARDIRMMSSLAVDYDGDGNVTEGIWYELDTLRDKLIMAIQAYATEFNPTDICYDSAAYPYFFQDTNGDGSCDATEAMFSNAYADWTARLERATYNYQYSLKDPGAHAHNPKYVMQIVFDSIMDLNSVLTTPIDMTGAERDDHGHFAGSTEPFRHWDGDGAVSGSCAKCHGGAEGLHDYLEFGGNAEVPLQNGLQCYTCHDGIDNGTGTADFTSIIDPGSVLFPSGVELDLDFTAGSGSNLCGTCHSGRESGVDVEDTIANGVNGEAGPYTFLNIHYKATAANRYGADAMVGVMYPGMTYTGTDSHVGGGDCINCHKPLETEHVFLPDSIIASDCSGCHPGAMVPEDIRIDSADYDGDGNTTEPLKDELATLSAALLVAMQTYATASLPDDICYSGSGYPYFFKDTDSSGVCEAGEATFANRYNMFDGPLLRAAFNYQNWAKDDGAWAHNHKFVGQLLFDSMEDLVPGSGSSFNRPTP